MYADDLWLKYHEVMNDIKVVWVPNNMIMPPIIEGSQNNSLKTKNLFGGRNDEYIRKLDAEYGNVLEHF